MNIVLMLAGGVGSRMETDIPKQFIKIRGKPIIAYTLDILEQNNNIDAVEIVCVHGYEDLLREIISEYRFQKTRWICEGGASFSLSVYAGLKNLRNALKPSDLLMIHMSVAPFINNTIIDDAIKVAKEKGNAISENPCYLCMGTRDTNEYSNYSVPRETITGLNTPQVFHFGELLDLYDQAEKDEIIEKIEPHTTSLYYHYGKKLYFSKGSQMNVKITQKDDLNLFEAFCIMNERANTEKSQSSFH